MVQLLDGDLIADKTDGSSGELQEHKRTGNLVITAVRLKCGIRLQPFRPTTSL